MIGSVDRGRILISIVCFCMGVAMAAQWRSQESQGQTPVVASSVDQSYMIANLVESNARLRDEIETLESQALRARQEAPQDTLATLADEISRLQVANGLVEAYGPGLAIRLDGRVGVFDVQDVLNELRNAGAEGLSLNGQRVVATSVTAQASNQILLDGAPIGPPYVFTAIGDPQNLQMAIVRHGGALDLLRSTYQGVKVEVEQRSAIVLPVYRGSYSFHFAAASR